MSKPWLQHVYWNMCIVSTQTQSVNKKLLSADFIPSEQLMSEKAQLNLLLSSINLLARLSS